MANDEHVALLKQGVDAWNAGHWRSFRQLPHHGTAVVEDIREAALRG